MEEDFADLRNMCSHKKDIEPTEEQVEELLNGAEWLARNVFSRRNAALKLTNLPLPSSRGEGDSAPDRP